MSNKPEEKDAILNEEELAQVSGGANPFADLPRTPTNDYDEEIKNKVINKFDDNGVEIEVLNGRFGPYIARDGVNYKIAKGTDAKALTIDDCRKIIAEQADKAPAKKAKTTKTAAKTTTKAASTKTAAKKSTKKSAE